MTTAICGICGQTGDPTRSCRYCSARSWGAVAATPKVDLRQRLDAIRTATRNATDGDVLAASEIVATVALCLARHDGAGLRELVDACVALADRRRRSC